MRYMLILLLSWAILPAFGLEMTADTLFNQMEQRTEQIYSLETLVELSSGLNAAEVTLSIQSPDKFAMDFQNNIVRIVFDGESLWVHLALLNEVFFLDAAGGGSWLSVALRQWVNPKEIITKVTRKTLFHFFDAEILPEIPASGGVVVPLAPLPDGMLASGTIVAGPEEATNGWVMRFIPKVGSWYKKFFEVGHYEMTFSKASFLPVLVKEFAPSGPLRGSLRVIRFKINQDIPRERFVFVVPPGSKLVPISEVLMQKLDQSKDLLLNQVDKWFEQLKQKMQEWGW